MMILLPRIWYTSHIPKLKYNNQPTMTDKTEFLPFHAINEYMRPDFRLMVIRDTLSNQATLDENLSNDLNHLIKKYVTVPGFRSSEKAPALVKVLPTSKAFEKNPDLVVVILSCWVETQSKLREQAYAVLKARGWPLFVENEDLTPTAAITDTIKEWPIFPITMDRAKLPGFYIHWPKGEDFEALYKTYSELYPDLDASIDKVSLMMVWLSMRLPLQVDVDLVKPDESELTSPAE
jgi:hypothetical protein